MGMFELSVWAVNLLIDRDKDVSQSGLTHDPDFEMGFGLGLGFREDAMVKWVLDVVVKWWLVVVVVRGESECRVGMVF